MAPVISTHSIIRLPVDTPAIWMAPVLLFRHVFKVVMELVISFVDLLRHAWKPHQGQVVMLVEVMKSNRDKTSSKTMIECM